MTEHEAEESQRTTDRPASEPVAKGAPMRELASVIGNQAFVAGVLPGSAQPAGVDAPRPPMSIDSVLRDAVRVELARALRPDTPRTRGAAERAIQRVPPQGAVIRQLAELDFTAQQAGRTGAVRRPSPIRNPQRMVSALSEAVASAWTTFQMTATIAGITVNAVTATGGILTGPPLEGLILGRAPMDGAAERRLSVAVAMAVGSAFRMWQATFKFLGQPLFPSFAAVPASVAPPTPGVPMPLIAVSPNLGPMAGLGPTMIGIYGDPQDAAGNAVCSALASGIERTFDLWLASTMVTNVMGTGPVPTFAPPYVPVGPVVGGIANMLPGGLI